MPKDEREGESRVYKVCNLSRRRYVKSFPAIGHWLSLVPILPFLDLMVELFCCWVMPDTFGRYGVKDYDESQSQEPAAALPDRHRARGHRHRSRRSTRSGAVGDLFGKFVNFKDVARDST